MIKFVYTAHAEKRIKERSISKQLIEKIYFNPDKVFPAREDTERAVKFSGGFKIIVTFEELKRKEKTIKIISVHRKKR